MNADKSEMKSIGAKDAIPHPMPFLRKRGKEKKQDAPARESYDESAAKATRVAAEVVGLLSTP